MKEIKTNHMQAVSLMPSPLYCKGEKEVNKLMATLYVCIHAWMYMHSKFDNNKMINKKIKKIYLNCKYVVIRNR